MKDKAQAAEKDQYASLRSIVSLQRTVSTSPLVDLSRASPLDLFEQPAKRLPQQLLMSNAVQDLCAPFKRFENKTQPVLVFTNTAIKGA